MTGLCIYEMKSRTDGLEWSMRSPKENVEKTCPEPGRRSRQRRSRHFEVLTYCEYAPRIKMVAALPVEKGVLAPLGLGG